MSRRRPSSPPLALDRARILSAARELLAQGGLDAVTMRGLARRLQVDAMTVRRHFSDREAVLCEAATEAYATLRVPLTGPWRRRLHALGAAYTGLLATSAELLRALTARTSATRGAARHLEQLFGIAVEPLALPERDLRAAHDAFVDLARGFALGVPATGLTPALRRRLRAELEVLADGLAARAAARA